MIHVPRHVVIVGGSAGRDNAREHISEHTSIWCVARIYDKVPYANYVFDMHTSAHQWSPATYQAHTEQKLILQQPIDEFPNAHLLPTQELRAEFGSAFTSSFAWMVAYAIYRDAEMISLLGVNMMHSSELGQQRDGLLYLLGYARAKRIRLNTSHTSHLRQGVRI